MKTHTTNYTNTLIEIVEDSLVSASLIPNSIKRVKAMKLQK